MRTALLALTLLATSHLGALTLDEFAGNKTLWTQSKDEVASSARPLRFVWVSQAKDTLRSDKGGSVFGLDAGETLIRFDAKSGHVHSIEASLFNRGDKGEISDADFKAKITRATEALDKISGTKASSIKDDKQSAVHTDSAVWAGPDATYRLDWNNIKKGSKRPEFLNLQILPAGKIAGIVKAAAERNADPSATFKAADHLESTADGDKWIKDVPMVDQGKKGYCAVATTERVLRFYGLPVDEHEIAELAGSSSEGGTSYAKLQKTFSSNDFKSKVRVRMKTLLDTDDAFFNSLVSDYNGVARKTKVTQLPNPKTNAHAFYSAFSFDKLDGETLLNGRKKNSSGVRKFESMVASAVDKSIPILWGVTLGIVPETPALPQAKGGHMRLIIGYNPKNHTIIYTDSWGAGHERKVMAADNAFAITNGMMELIP